MFRVDQYKWQIKEMLECDYPRTKIFFPETLYARFVEIDFKHYTPTLGVLMTLLFNSVNFWHLFGIKSIVN